MKVQSGFLALTAAFVMVSGGCSSNPTGSSGAGGTTGTGGGTAGSSGGGKAGTTGSSGGGTGGSSSCSNVTACGGNVVGTWTVSSSCLTLNDTNVDITLAGLSPDTCMNVAMTGSLNVSGTWTANTDGTYTDATMTSGTAQIQLPAGCLQLSGTTTTCSHIQGPLAALGFNMVTCAPAATGGGCACTGTIQQMGSIGALSPDPQTSGNYTPSGNTLTADGTISYPYCVSGTQLTMTPQPTSPTTKGTVVLTRSGSTGTGGTTGTAGTTGTGVAGTTGSAGTRGTAGTGVGGTTGSAGRGGAAGTSATGSGGRGGAAGTTAVGGTTGAGGSTTVADGPCDIYATAGQPCAAAYSTIRVLSKTYTGPLYQIRSGSSSMNTGSGGTTKDISSVNGFADTTTQDTFCSGTTCTVSILYDQSGNGNNLKSAPAGLSSGGTYAAMPDFESTIGTTKASLMVGGHKVYSLYMNAREGYRTPVGVKGKNMPTGQMPQGIYELADGTHSGSACCWDFGNVSPDPTVYVVMNTLFFGTATFWGTGAGNGPWFMGDFENGVWAGGSGASGVNNPLDPSMKYQFAFGIVKTSGTNSYAIRAANGNLPTASALTTAYDGTGPKQMWGNSGGILLGIGGDNSNNSFGTFYEGAITAGRPADATDLAVLKNLQAAGYGN